ncbi:hypothetical protein EKH79_13810 [Dyella dinghuensis]|uniref:Oligosaccharide repeat unit polymerase n=1 Tax=Dyella dinghuensis TaxID=1920169 RepID=A0A3S0PBS8_9GAMM|nr:hypothetical protein [Dyella dinghuensis]RUL63456.1 hypothetical protein EKH79_13810 [Dyella dinghuensis]
MRQILRLPSFYLGIPILLTCGLTLLTYDLPYGYADGICLLAVTAIAIVLFDLWMGSRIPEITRFRSYRYAGNREAFVALAFSAVIVVFCVLDIVLFPMPLFDNPSSYATMEGGREHIRHISNMCWILPPVGILCVRSRWLRNLLIAIGLIFPVVVIDRNRIFATLYAFALVILFRRDTTRPLPWKTIAFLAVVGATVFSVLGTLRSGSLDTVALPFSKVYHALPQGVKWLLLYMSAGPYNFGAIAAKHYSNASFLINQLVPLSGSVATAGTDIPLDASNINVGTEFFPFLMAFGPAGAVMSVILLYAMLLWSVRLLRRNVSLFALLIFLRVSYVCVMSPFAPQAYTWTNFSFIALCLLLQVLATCLPNRNATRTNVTRGAIPTTH